MGNRCGRSSDPSEATAASAALPAAASSASSLSSSSAALPMSKPDARQLSHRLRGALQLQQRLDKHLPMQPRDRGMLMAALAALYAHEEVDAREKLARERAKKRTAATAAAAEVADSAAFVAMFSEVAEDAAAAWAVTPAPSAAAASAAPAAALPADCQVCFSTFNTEFEGAWTLRVHMTLCGHASICSDCFRTYLTTRIQADDVMPFIGCPEPGCKLPLSHFDITGNAPTLEAANAFEVAQAKDKENAAKRDQAAVQRKAQRKLFAAKQAQAAAVSSVVVAGRRDSSAAASASSTTASESDDESSPAQRKSKKHDAPSPKKKRAPAPGARRKSSAAAASSDEESAALDVSLLSLEDAVPQAPSLTPAAPAITAARPPPLLSTELLLKLTLTHLSKALRQCKDWLPCGTHLLTPPVSASLSAPVAPAPDAPAADAASAASVAASSSSSAAPSAAAAAAAPSAPACPFGFVLMPSFGVVVTKDKLKKCELCGLLQCVKPKTPENRVDGSMESMIAEGTLRACPICEALQMKDLGMCNILQCHQCSIWWNWESRQTGKNSATLKDLARRQGTMWMPGELQYQLQLQRDDPAAFKALLARNGIEWNPNYVRGSTK